MATEKRLIDANEYPCNRCEISYCYKNCDKFNAWFENTVDAVEVVRCKECKHYHQYHVGKTNDLCEWGKCKLINMDVDMPENGFCSYGERRSDATE